MDLDNPSYFSVASGSNTPGNFSFFQCSSTRMGNTESVSSSSDCSLSRQLTPPKGSNRRNARGFLRSVSSNSADSNQELLIMGEPRLSDIAPDLAFKHPPEPRRSNSLKTNKSELQRQDLLYCPLPTSENPEISEDEEVFITEDSARYYNLSNQTAEQRRHSIGTFMMRDRTVSVGSSSRSIKEETIKAATPMMVIDDHSLRHGSYPRKRCHRCTKGLATKTANMDDILIVSLKNSQAANLWVDYFTTYFQQISKQANRKPFKVQHIGAEEVTGANGDIKFLAERASGVKLQLLVICPGFLEHISQNPEESCGLGKLLSPDRTLALLLGVHDDDLTEVHKKALSTYTQWQRFGVGQDQDENFTKEFLAHAMAIFSKIWKQQSSVSAHEKSQFSVSPKKIRQGQNSVLILLTYPLQREDVIKVSIEKNNELVEIKSLKRRNPYTLKIVVPDSLSEVSAIVNVLVEKNGSIIGSRPIKCESKLRELEQILRSSNSPMEFMCQTLGFSPPEKDQLDNWMMMSFQKNVPTHFNLLSGHNSPHNTTALGHKHSHEEFPTLLHFAAKFGLEKLAMQLLDCPGGDIAYDIRNVCDLTPAEIAENAGHTTLASILKGYMKMNEFTCMYSKLKEISLHTSKQPTEDEDEKEEYLQPNNFAELYKICPPPRPVNPLNLPTTAEIMTPLGYMNMNTPAKPKTPSTTSTNSETSTASAENLKQQIANDKALQEIESPKTPKNLDTCEDKVQKELLEIINDFKNNVHSISQVEKLVDEWKNRNDVQKSFKEKQEQLNEMRLKYEKIQQDMKTSMRKATPFDRVKKLFTRSKSREEKTETSLLNPNLVVVSSQRPISSLSLQSTSSSGSSGRMSTISGCSLGDSGTQSDPEDRKHIIVGSHDDDFRNDLSRAVMSLNYQTVPAPKPFKPGMFANRIPFETIEERPKPDPIATNDEHYILFPPSGLPVPGAEELIKQMHLEEQVEQLNGGRNQYINLPASPGALTARNVGHEYMNFNASQMSFRENAKPIS